MARLSEKVTEKVQAIGAAIAQIEKQFGKGAIMRLGGESEVSPIAAIPTGSLGLDLALGVGGLSAWARCRDLWPGVIRQDDDDTACHCRGAEARWGGGLY